MAQTVRLLGLILAMSFLFGITTTLQVSGAPKTGGVR